MVSQSEGKHCHSEPGKIKTWDLSARHIVGRALAASHSLNTRVGWLICFLVFHTNFYTSIWVQKWTMAFYAKIPLSLKIFFFQKVSGMRSLTTPILEDSTPSCAIHTHLPEVFIYPWGARAQNGTENRLHPTMPHWKNPAATNQNVETTLPFFKKKNLLPTERGGVADCIPMPSTP